MFYLFISQSPLSLLLVAVEFMSTSESIFFLIQAGIISLFIQFLYSRLVLANKIENSVRLAFDGA